jgi:hypothetical protein
MHGFQPVPMCGSMSRADHFNFQTAAGRTADQAPSCATLFHEAEGPSCFRIAWQGRTKVKSTFADHQDRVARQKELIELSPSRSSPRGHNSNYASRLGSHRFSVEPSGRSSKPTRIHCIPRFGQNLGTRLEAVGENASVLVLMENQESGQFILFSRLRFTRCRRADEFSGWQERGKSIITSRRSNAA